MNCNDMMILEDEYRPLYLSREGNLVDLENYSNLGCCLYPNPNWDGTDKLDELTSKLWSELKIGGKKQVNKQKALKNLLINLLDSYYKGKVLSFSRDRNYYSVALKQESEFFTYTNNLEIIDKLVEADFLEAKTGYYDRTSGEGRRSRAWATERFLEYINWCSTITLDSQSLIKTTELNNQSITYFDSPFYTVKSKYPILVHEKKKPRYALTPEECKGDLFNSLSQYNNFMDDQVVLLPFKYVTTTTAPIASNYNDHAYGMAYNYSTSINDSIEALDPITQIKSESTIVYKQLDTSCHRVFNDSGLATGGRFYCSSYQGENQESRSTILINGMKSVEIDYSAYHISMLYHMENIDVTNDPYDLFDGNKELRKCVKLMTNMAFNSKGENSAIRAFNWELNRGAGNYEKRRRRDALKKAMQENSLSAAGILGKVIENHKEIGKYFFTNYGLTLQRYDSDVASSVVTKLRECKIPSLIVHDSFLVPQENALDLENAMRESYKAKFGFQPKISVK